MVYENCYQCAARSNRKLCTLGGHVKDPWTGPCCDLDDTSTECTPKHDENECSPGTFETLGHMFYSYCPLNNHTMCTDGTTTDFIAEASPKSFKFSKLKRSASPEQYDACLYTISIPEHKYESAIIFFRANVLDQVDIFINAGTDKNNASETLIKNNGTVTLYQ